MGEKHDRSDSSVYRLSEDEREALEQSAADMREGRFAHGRAGGGYFQKVSPEPKSAHETSDSRAHDVS
jgi:hypothetical protein